MKTTEFAEGTEGIYADLTRQVFGCAIEVHRTLGPGLLEATYEQCLTYELNLNKIEFRFQAPLPVNYKGIALNCGYRIDLLVEECLIVELKAVESISALHEAQLLTYMKLSESPIGLLINFNVTLLKKGVHRFVL